MASKTFKKDLEDRTGTDEEVAAIAGAVGMTIAPAPPLTPYRGDREDDQPDRPPSEAPLPLNIPGPEITTEEVSARLLKALESIETRAKDGGSSDLLAMAMLQLAEGLKSIKEGQLQAAQIVANMQRSTMAPENRFGPDISAYNPRGEREFPRPRLRCKYFLPWPVDPGAAEEFTREEIQLLNLVEPGEHTILRADRTKIKVLVRIEKKFDSDEPSHVVFHHDTAFNNDYHRLMPHDWIRQLVELHPKSRAAGRAVLTMEEEEALILARKFNDGRDAAVGERVVSIGA